MPGIACSALARLTVAFVLSRKTARAKRLFVDLADLDEAGVAVFGKARTGTEEGRGGTEGVSKGVLLVLAEPVEEGASVKETIGKAYALGQVHKKMVLIPDWGKLYA